MSFTERERDRLLAFADKNIELRDFGRMSA